MIAPGPTRPPVVSRSTTQNDASLSGTRSAAQLRNDHSEVAVSKTKLGSEARRVLTIRAARSGSEPAPASNRPSSSRASAPAGRDSRNAYSFSLVVARGSRAISNLAVSTANPASPTQNDYQVATPMGMRRQELVGQVIFAPAMS